MLKSLLLITRSKVNPELESFCIGSSMNVSAPAPLHDVPLQHWFLVQDAPEAESAQVQRFKAPIEDQFCHCTTHCGGVLQAVAAETGHKVHVVNQGVNPNDAVLVEGVVVVETCPGAAHLRTRRTAQRLRYTHLSAINIE